MAFVRSHYQPLKGRIEEKRRFIQVLMGPRQVGKTTLVTQLLRDIDLPHHFASADGVVSAGPVWLEQQWEAARAKWKQSEAEAFLLVIDEVQKIQNWSEAVKGLWDTDTREERPLKVILLGSSRLLLQQGLTESLAGRFEVTYMGHWSFSEMQAAFGWEADQYVWFGGYPGSADLIADEERWKNYVANALVETSISKDILMLTRVDKPALMRRLFELGCLYSGQILSYSKMLGQLQDAGNTTTLSHYLDLLDTAGLLAGIEKYAPDQLRQRASSPKFQVHNSALISAQRPETLEQVRLRPEQWGRMVESAIGAHLLNHALSRRYSVHYWRHRNAEIDFVISKKGTVIGLEIKSGATQKASGMQAFQNQFSPDKVLLVGSTGLPWQEFLQLDPYSLF
ncbi:ATP-binding protein [soil metagenome]